MDIEVIVLDYYKNIASVKVVTKDYYEYLHLIKTDKKTCMPSTRLVARMPKAVRQRM